MCCRRWHLFGQDEKPTPFWSDLGSQKSIPKTSPFPCALKALLCMISALSHWALEPPAARLGASMGPEWGLGGDGCRLWKTRLSLLLVAVSILKKLCLVYVLMSAFDVKGFWWGSFCIPKQGGSWNRCCLDLSCFVFLVCVSVLFFLFCIFFFFCGEENYKCFRLLAEADVKRLEPRQANTGKGKTRRCKGRRVWDLSFVYSIYICVNQTTINCQSLVFFDFS